MNEPSVAIAILNWNGKSFLETLLPALQHLTYPAYAVYVIDNNSSDDSLLFIRAHFPSVTIIALPDNYGFATGYNKGFAEIQEDFYLMMNSDIEVEAGFIEPLVAMMQSDEKIAVCQPKIRSLRNRKMFEHAGAAGGMIDQLGYPFCRGRMFDVVEEDKGQYDDAIQIFWATGTCCLLRKQAYWQVGGMYGFYFMHMEEIDLCWRLNAASWKVMYCPQSIIYHLGGGSLPYHSPRKIYFNFRNNIIMCWRNSPWYVKVWLLPLRMMLDAAAAVQFLLGKQGTYATAIGKAYLHFFRWLLSTEKSTLQQKLSLRKAAGSQVFSVVWAYYVRKKKKYSQLLLPSTAKA